MPSDDEGDAGKGEGDLIDRLDAKASPGKRSAVGSPSSAGSPQSVDTNPRQPGGDADESEITPSAKEDTSSAAGSKATGGGDGPSGKGDDSWK